ncbi:MAG: cobalamin biosynthesis protein CobQ [Pseudomonadota bacterium]
MNTQTHVLLAAALFAKPQEPARNTAVIAGALVPDLAIYTLFVWSKLAGIPERTVWSQLYFEPPWADAVMIGNAAPIYILVLVIGVAAANRIPQASLLTYFALAALLHLATDFPVHADDAHAHFWPLTDWRFRSPVSYWDPARNGNWFALFEILVGVVLSYVLWRRFRAAWVRVLLVLAVVAYIGPPLYFGLLAGL